MPTASSRVGGAKKDDGGRGREKIGMKVVREKGFEPDRRGAEKGVVRDEEEVYHVRMEARMRESWTRASRYCSAMRVSQWTTAKEVEQNR